MSYGESYSSAREREQQIIAAQRVTTLQHYAGTAPVAQSVEMYDENETQDWRPRGLCTKTDPDTFFGDKAASQKDAAKACQPCPVIEECREYGLKTRQQYGVWGGLTERQRRVLWRITEQ